MSRHKQPHRLELLSLHRLADWVALQAESQLEPITDQAQRNRAKAHSSLSHVVQCLKMFLEYNIPWMLYDPLLVESIRTLTELIEKIKNSHGFRLSMGKFVSQMNVIVSMIEVIFSKHITTLSIDNIPKIMRSIFYTKLDKLPGLVNLNLGSLSGGWKTSDMESSIIQSLQELHNLKQLTINYDCTDGVLRCIVENCKNMEKLDVSSSKCITNESINILSDLKNLKSIQLYRTSVTLEGFARLLVKCRGLEDIGKCDEIGRVLEYLDLTNSDVRPLKLTSYVSRYATQSHLHLAVEMCPCIKNMTIFHNTLQGDLMVLIMLKDLTELKLLSCDFYADQIKQVLQVKGCHITHLHLEHVDQIDLNALMYISQLCPLLECLTLYNCTLIQHTSLYTSKLEILPFRNLKQFTCVSNCTHDQLMFVLSNCVNVKFIHIGTAIQLSDEFMLKLLEKNPLIYLKELRVMQSDCLSMISIERIIQSCMSLEILVELESWTLLSDMDREYVKKYIKMNNFNINTEPIRRYDA